MSVKIHLEIRILMAKTICITITGVNTKVVLYWDQPFLVGCVRWEFSCSTCVGQKPFLVYLVINFFNRPQNKLKRLKENLRNDVT